MTQRYSAFEIQPVPGSPEVQVIAGDGLSGGGPLNTDVTLDVVVAAGLLVDANEVSVDTDYDFVWTGYHQFQAMPTFNAGLEVGGTSSGLFQSNIGDAAGYIQFKFKPSVALTSGVDRHLFEVQSSSGATVFQIRANGSYDLAGGGGADAFINATRRGAEAAGFNFGLQSTAAVGIDLTGSLGSTFSNSITGMLNQASGATSCGAVSFVGGVSACGMYAAPTATTLNNMFGHAAGFTSFSGMSGKTVTWAGSFFGAGMVGAKSQGTVTNWANFYAANASRYAMGSGSALTAAVGFYTEQQTRAGTTNGGFWAVSATAGYKCYLVGDTSTWLAWESAGVGSLNATTWQTKCDLDYQGDTYYTASGSGLPFGSCWGNELTQAMNSMAQNTWYLVSDTGMTDGQLNLCTHDGSGKLTVTKAGKYLVNWSFTGECSASNKHCEGGIAVSGTVANDGQAHFESSANQEFCIGSTAILSVAASATFEVAIRTTDTGTPNVLVDDMNLSIVQIGA